MSDMFPSGAALIFGGTGGIGRAVALEFGRAGSHVALAYHTNRSVADEVTRALRDLGREATSHAADVAQPAQIEAVIEEASHSHGRLHTIVFAAGPLVEQKYLAEVSPEAWRQAIETEATGFFNVFRASVGRMREWGGGSFVHLGSAGHLVDSLSCVSTLIP